MISHMLVWVLWVLNYIPVIYVFPWIFSTWQVMESIPLVINEFVQILAVIKDAQIRVKYDNSFSKKINNFMCH